MTAAEIEPDILAYYDGRTDEDSRLSRTADGALELLRTQELLRPRLPPAPATVLDVGGGTGVHARWLAADGYAVHVVDPVSHHVERAAGLPGCTAEVGDARALRAGDGTYDVVLLLGPLYHLTERADRLAALAQARRVVRPGGLVAAAGINRYAPVFDNTATTRLGAGENGTGASVADIVATGVHRGMDRFTTAYFHTAAELAGELAEAGLPGAGVHGVEGPSWGLLRAVELHTGEHLTGSPLFTAALEAARIADGYPELLAASSHLLAITRRPA
ncbi:class I SAM-dependent methyltransferase [Streptomyces xiamenensis]